MDAAEEKRLGFKPVQFDYEVRVRERFEQPEIALLLHLSSVHYDWKCKAAGQEGGFLFQISGCVANVPDFDHRLSFGEIDTMCKILEISSLLKDDASRIQAMGLMIRFKRLLNAINAEYRRLNGE